MKQTKPTKREKKCEHKFNLKELGQRTILWCEKCAEVRLIDERLSFAHKDYTNRYESITINQPK